KCFVQSLHVSPVLPFLCAPRCPRAVAMLTSSRSARPRRRTSISTRRRRSSFGASMRSSKLPRTRSKGFPTTSKRKNRRSIMRPRRTLRAS
ncbi:hypothetical protein H4R20_006917, partial [Coemansia guatemalensis]